MASLKNYFIHLFSVLGNTEICGVESLDRDDASSFQWLLFEMFQVRNECWTKTKLMTDKDFTSRKILSRKFTNAKLLCANFTFCEPLNERYGMF